MKQNQRIPMNMSKYNFIVYSVANTNVIYNTLQDSITAVKKSHPFKFMSIVDLKKLHDQGVILNSSIDEKAVFKFRNMSQKFNGRRLHIFITLTGACNCQCPYCFSHDCYSGATISSEDISLILKFIYYQLNYHRSKMMHVDFFGGEPMLCENIYKELMVQIKKLSEQHKVYLTFQFYSNGTIRPSSGYEFFAKNYNVTYAITLDGPRDVHDKLRPMKNGESGFFPIINNLKEIKRVGGKATIRINFGKTSYVHIPKLLDELVQLKLTNFPIEFYPVQNMTQSSSEYEDAIKIADLPRLMSFLWAESQKRRIPVYTRTLTANCYCSAFTSSMFVIDPKLNIYKCALLQCDPKYSIGNLKRNTDFLRDSTFYDWVNYDPSSEKKCCDCKCLPICAGGCGGSGTFKYGTHHHSNCYDLSPIMLKIRMERYVADKYESELIKFEKSNDVVLILEKNIYRKP